MSICVSIRNHNLPKKPRVFDVIVNEHGDILKYEMQNIKGAVFIDDAEVKKQIKEELIKRGLLTA